MNKLLMLALLAAGFIAAVPAKADDMNPTDTRAEFTARKAHHGKYVPAKPAKKHHMMKKAEAKKPMAKKHMKKGK